MEVSAVCLSKEEKGQSLVLNCGNFGFLDTETARANKINTLDKEKNRKEKTTSKEKRRIDAILLVAERVFFQEELSLITERRNKFLEEPSLITERRK